MKSTFEDILSREGSLVYTNVGVSMMPLLRQGKDLMYIESVQHGEPLYRLDSVLFKRTNGQYVLHRIMDKADAESASTPDKIYRICGDNTMQLEPVRRDMIIGRLIGVDRGAGKSHPRHIDVTSRSYRIYSWIMWGLWPCRRVYFPIRWRLGRLVKWLLRLAKRTKNQ